MGGFLDYIEGQSFFHKLNPITKFLLALILCISCFISTQIVFVLAIIMLTMVIGINSGAGERCFKSLKALSKLSIMVFVVQVLFIPQGNVYFHLPFSIPITDLGVHFSLLFALRLLAATLPLILMLSITSMSDLSGVLVEKLHVPYKYAFALTTAIRFIPVFSAEMNDITEAQTARGVEFDTKNIFKKIALILPLCVPLLISSVKRINNGAMAVVLRGFYYRKSGNSYKSYNFHARDSFVILLGFAIIALAILLKINFFGFSNLLF